MISEIMYNPDSSETCGRSEWIEIFNTSPTTVNLGGWSVRDEDKTSTTTLAGGTHLAPFEAEVLAPNSIAVADFQAAWGDRLSSDPCGRGVTCEQSQWIE